MTRWKSSSFSHEGPECPGCGHTWKLDESCYFDENGYELHCDECETDFSVQPHALWSWTGRKITEEDK
jgi:transcription elongation factor Elf1